MLNSEKPNHHPDWKPVDSGWRLKPPKVRLSKSHHFSYSLRYLGFVYILLLHYLLHFRYLLQNIPVPKGAASRTASWYKYFPPPDLLAV